MASELSEKDLEKAQGRQRRVLTTVVSRARRQKLIPLKPVLKERAAGAGKANGARNRAVASSLEEPEAVLHRVRGGSDLFWGQSGIGEVKHCAPHGESEPKEEEQAECGKPAGGAGLHPDPRKISLRGKRRDP